MDRDAPLLGALIMFYCGEIDVHKNNNCSLTYREIKKEMTYCNLHLVLNRFLHFFQFFENDFFDFSEFLSPN